MPYLPLSAYATVTCLGDIGAVLDPPGAREYSPLQVHRAHREDRKDAMAIRAGVASMRHNSLRTRYPTGSSDYGSHRRNSPLVGPINSLVQEADESIAPFFGI